MMEKEHQEYDEQAMREVELQRAYALSMLPVSTTGVFGYAAAAMKALILVNSGSAAALLALMGHLVTQNQGEAAKALGFPLCIFLVSAIFAAGSFGLSYLSQLYMNHTLVYLCLWKEEYSKDYQRASKFNRLYQRLAIFTTLIAFGLCFFGIWTAYRVFMAF
ncbi:MAG: hypothetical protein LBJ36_05740 [Synergistaceae bacterium]|jgi:hypothetical protein|nr:hypothetical protein [Synergistaceae bacterium]